MTRRTCRAAGLALSLLMALMAFFSPARTATASPGVCVGPVCGDEISRSATRHWQLRLRVSDQDRHDERIVVDCRYGVISPRVGPVERGHAAAVARRLCRLAGEA
jgi:hypothetical protein